MATPSLWRELEIGSDNVVPTGRYLGEGSFADVREFERITTDGSVRCAGKTIHQKRLLDSASKAEFEARYAEECSLLSHLDHPNVVKFLGVTFFSGDSELLPTMLMELMMTNLHDYLQDTPNIVFAIKSSFLTCIARGLAYLHDMRVIHRDLTAKNVMLSSKLVPKISDFGTSLNVKGTNPEELTRDPGTAVYMPPEASEGSYSYSLDVFSFGHLALFIATQEFPCKLLSTIFIENEKPSARTEIERREHYFQLLYSQVGRKTHPLVQLIKRCLAFRPNLRPTARELEDLSSKLSDTQSLSSSTEVIEVLSQYSAPNVMEGIVANWYALGMELSVDEDLLDHIEESPNAEEPPLLRVLTTWIQQSGKPTWKILAEALKNPSLAFVIGGIEEVASKIERHGSAKESSLYTDEQADTSPEKEESDLLTELMRFHLDDTRETNLILGNGFNSVVKEFNVGGVVMAGKVVIGEKKRQTEHLRECVLVSKLQHSHVVQFCGLHFPSSSSIPIMLMEKMEIDLSNFLSCVPKVSLSVKLTVFLHIARGLVYLHSQSPAVVHCDLTPRRVLLDGALVAKIGNFRMARLCKEEHSHFPSRPTLFFAADPTGNYDTPLDLLSFGHLMLCTTVYCQQQLSTLADEYERSLSAVDYQNQLFQNFRRNYGERHMLDGIVKECLDESPLLRPDARDAMERLEQEQRNCWNPTDQIYAKAELKMLTDTDAVTKLTKLLPLPQVMSSQKVPHKAVYASVLCQRNQPGDRHRALEMMKEDIKNNVGDLSWMYCICGEIYNTSFLESSHRDIHSRDKAIYCFLKGLGKHGGLSVVASRYGEHITTTESLSHSKVSSCLPRLDYLFSGIVSDCYDEHNRPMLLLTRPKHFDGDQNTSISHFDLYSLLIHFTSSLMEDAYQMEDYTVILDCNRIHESLLFNIMKALNAFQHSHKSPIRKVILISKDKSMKWIFKKILEKPPAIHVVDCLADVTRYVSREVLPLEFGGTKKYNHTTWVYVRNLVKKIFLEQCKRLQVKHPLQREECPTAPWQDPDIKLSEELVLLKQNLELVRRDRTSSSFVFPEASRVGHEMPLPSREKSVSPRKPVARINQPHRDNN